MDYGEIWAAGWKVTIGREKSSRVIVVISGSVSKK
jgi:hypothetical protein